MTTIKLTSNLKPETKATRVFEAIEFESMRMLRALRDKLELEIELRGRYPSYIKNKLAEKEARQ